MFEKILLAVDGSEQSNKAVGVASKIAQSCTREGRASVEVRHIREFEHARPGGEVPAEGSSEAQAFVKAAIDELRADGVTAHGAILPAAMGNAAKTLLEEAKSTSADLIVIGSRGRSDFAALLLGSVAHKVVQYAACPVLIVR